MLTFTQIRCLVQCAFFILARIRILMELPTEAASQISNCFWLFMASHLVPL
ncbi:unnamed protein product [Mycetohabitans rhizoxinica HKI 454]|uniref:Uncharacterized protein n=1 Tax=Mycetohabitans rhizoxinica (strain DSM 19002 / CIP 109453 / HKI 454) TaxID=882378 RepID=E5AMT8_MYCRK|nr:unnamed protein product [Mycetohabitans rhizoxinica HKI 454]